MKIGIDTRLWNETGVGRYIRNLVKELQVLDKKNEYVLFVRSSDFEEVKFQISNFKFQIKIADIRWHTLEEQVKFPQILNRENLDLMHFTYFSIPINYKRPYAITIHDLILNHFATGRASKLPLPFYHLKRLSYKYVLKNSVRNAKKIIVPTNSVREDVLKTYKINPGNIVVTYEGVDESVKGKVLRANNYSPFTLHPSPYFLYIGNAYPHKNLDRLIKAFSEIQTAKNEALNLILVGKDDYFYKKLTERIKNERIEGVIIRNNVSDQELAIYYKNALALVAPSLMEGFGLPVLEALASDCLVLASDIPSFKEVASDAAIYFDPYSVNDIKSKLLQVYHLDKNGKEKLTKNGHDRAGIFSWEKMAGETLKIYESCVSASTA